MPFTWEEQSFIDSAVGDLDTNRWTASIGGNERQLAHWISHSRYRGFPMQVRCEIRNRNRELGIPSAQ